MSLGDLFGLSFGPEAPRIRFGLEQWSRDIRDFTPVFNLLFRVVEHHFRQQFATEGEITGPEWEALSEAYGEWKARQHPGKLKLHLTGRLKDSLTKDRASDAIRVASSRSAIFGTDVEYASAHQTGVPTRGLPARPIIRFNEDVAAENSLAWAASQIAQAFVVEQRKRRLGTSVDPDGSLEESRPVQAVLARLLTREIR